MKEARGDVKALQAALARRTIAAVATPMDGAGKVSSDVLRRYASAISSSVDGVCVWAHTGRGLHLEVSERKMALEAFRSACDGPVLAAVGPDRDSLSGDDFDDQLASTISMAQQAAELGADGLMVYPMASLRAETTRHSRTLQLHREVASSVNLPVIGFYLYEAAGGVAYDTHLLEELCGQPGVAGVKLALLSDAITCHDAIAAIQRGGGLAITGEDRMFGPSLMWGADAALVGLGAAGAHITTSVVDAWFDGDMDRFVRASCRLDAFATAVFRDPMDGYVQRMLWVAESEGIVPSGAALDPHGVPVSPDEKAEVIAAFHAALESE